jgi:hypothetical protein
LRVVVEWVVKEGRKEVGQILMELTTMVNYGTGTQKKSVS